MNRIRLGLILIVLIFSMNACGKKAPPFIEKKKFSVKVSGLKADRIGKEIVLKGSLKGNKESISVIKEGRVYYAQYPANDPPCEDCPIRYQGYDIFGPEIIKGNSFLCKFPTKPGEHIYYLKVYLIGPEGSQGPGSERIMIKKIRNGEL